MIAIAQRQGNPFPGLRPFREEESDIFFGRENQVDELLIRLQRNRFLAVVGSSGNGKSSLVRAGLLPSLYSGSMTEAGSRWHIANMRPGGSPIHHLACSLSEPGVLDKPGIDREMRSLVIETTLRRSSLGLSDLLQQANINPNDNLLIVVDQFEELFRFKQSTTNLISADEAYAFVKLLLNAVKHPNIYVLITMRSDFLGDCAEFQGLPEILNDNQYLISRLNRDQRRRAIEGPIAVSGGSISPRLVNQLLNDIGNNLDQLPVLQHALMRTWNRWSRDHQTAEPIDLRHYEAIGGIENALSFHADEIYRDLQRTQFSNSNFQKTAEVLFKRLTEKGQDNREIRHPTQLSEICDVAKASSDEVMSVVEKFRQPECSFLMPPAGVPLTPETIIDISHESLMRVWQTLKGWIEQESQSAELYRDLDRLASRHQDGKAGLLQEPELTIYSNWQQNNEPNSAWAERYTSPTESYELLLCTAESLAELPAKGNHTLIIAKVGDAYHVRVFDRSGRITLDKGKGEFSPDDALIQQIKNALAGQKLSEQDKQTLVQKTLADLGDTRFKRAIAFLDLSSLTRQLTAQKQRKELWRRRIIWGTLALVMTLVFYNLDANNRVNKETEALNKELEESNGKLLESVIDLEKEQQRLVALTETLQEKQNVIDDQKESLDQADDNLAAVIQAPETVTPDAQPEVIQAQVTDVIQQYLENKETIFGKQILTARYDAQSAMDQIETFFTGAALIQTKESIRELQKSQSYYTYGALEIGTPEEFTANETLAIVKLCIEQDITLYENNQRSDTDIDGTGLWQFTLSQVEGTWKINNRREVGSCSP